MTRVCLHTSQRGASLLLVLMLLAVMLFGALAFSRMGMTGIILAGNTAQKEASLRASEIGVNKALEELQSASFNPSGPVNGRYSPQRLASNSQGMPTGINWGNAPTLTVNEFTVAYYIERMCDTAAPTNLRASCLVQGAKELNSARGIPTPVPRNVVTYRATVRIVDPRGATTFTQTLITR